MLEVGFISLKLSAAEVADALVIAGQAAPAGLGALIAGGVVVSVLGVGANSAKGMPYNSIQRFTLTSGPSPKARFLYILYI